MIHFPRPKSSIPRKRCDPVRFRGQTHSQGQGPNRTSIGKTGHHIERVVKTIRRLMFKLIPYEKEN